MFLIVTDAEKFHQSILGVTSLERAHEVGAFCRSRGVSHAALKARRRERKPGGEDRDRKEWKAQDRGGETTTHALSDVPLTASALFQSK